MGVLDYSMLFLTVVIVLLVGWLSGRKSRSSRDASEFLTADKRLNKLQVGFSMAATDFGGSGLVGAIGYVYLFGMSGIWWNLAAAPAFFIVGVFLAKHFNRMDGTTLPEYLGKRYSPAVRYIACVIHICMNIAALAVQFTVSCAVLHTLTGLPMSLTLIISMLIVIFMTSGGLKTVVNTDAMLFVVIVISVLIAVPITLRAGGGFESIVAQVPEGFMRMDQLGFWTPISWILLTGLSYSTSQNYVQRMVSAKDEGTAVFSALFTAGFYILISVAIGLIGVAAYVLLPGLEDTNTLFPRLMVEFFPSGVLGLGVAGIFAATISTGTSILHATATLAITDLWKPLFGRRKIDTNDLKISRIAVGIIAALSLCIALVSSDIVNVLYIGGLFYGASVFAPMLFGMKGRFVTARAAMISMISTVALSLAWEYFPAIRPPFMASIPSNVFGLCISIAILLISSLIDRRWNQGKSSVLNNP